MVPRTNLLFFTLNSHFQEGETLAKHYVKCINFSLTLFHTGSVTYVITRGGAIMARIDLSRHRFTQRPPTTLNLFPDKYFDLWLSIDTKSSPLCGILLRLRAVKWRWSKMKIFKRKKVKISNFGLQKCYIPQKKAENIYNKDSARKS